MRYTTIIDIRESPELYRSQSIRLIYLHLVLRSGYHDNDRDLCKISIRTLAADVGITVSATRHALHVLEKMKMVKHQGSMYRVRKWVALEKPSKRKQPRTDEETREREERQLELERNLEERKRGAVTYEEWQKLRKDD